MDKQSDAYEEITKMAYSFIKQAPFSTLNLGQIPTVVVLGLVLTG